MIKHLDNYISWKWLKIIPSNKIVSSSYIWLVIVPVIAKFLSYLESPLPFELGGQVIQLDTELPFSWKVFFLSAMFFTFGNIIFFFACPALVKRYRNFDDYALNHGAHEELDL